MRHLSLITLVLAMTVSACASAPTLYAPSLEGGYGYSHQRIESDRYRIRFDAGNDKSLAEVGVMALYRAAELTLEEGADWFLVIDRDMTDEGGSVMTPTIGVARTFGTYRSGSSISLGIHIDPNAGEKSVVIEILTRFGEISDDMNAYDARDILANSSAQ